MLTHCLGPARAVLALTALALTFLATTRAQPSASPPQFRARDAGATLLLTYSRTSPAAAKNTNDTPGLVFALWDDGWALARRDLRADHAQFVAMRFSKDSLERMKAVVAKSGVESPDIQGLGMAADQPYATLKVRTAGGVRTLVWNEQLTPVVARPEQRPHLAAWIACTSIVVSEAPEEILDERVALKLRIFRGLNPLSPEQWPADEKK